MEMEMEFLRKLPTPQELKEQHPVSAQIVATKTKRDEKIFILDCVDSVDRFYITMYRHHKV